MRVDREMLQGAGACLIAPKRPAEKRSKKKRTKLEGEKTTWKHTVEDGTATRVLVTGRDQPSEPDFALFSPTFIPSLLFLSLPLDSPIVIDWVSVGRSLDSSKLTQTIGKRIWRSLSLAVSSGANSISLSLLSAFFFINRIQLVFFFPFIKETHWAGKATHGKVKCNSLFPTRHLVTHGSHSVWLERCIYSDSDFSFEGLWSLLFSTQSAPIAMYSHERCRGAWKSLCRSRSRPKKATIFFSFSWLRWLYGAHSLAVAGKKKKKKKKSTLVTPLFIPVLHYVLSTWFSRLFRRPENTQRILDCPALQQY